jgi:CheY-like chemotaxis protein
MPHRSKVIREVTVLLVDDDDVDVMGVKRAFSELKIANPIVVAGNGIEAFEILRGEKINRPFLILLDLNMPRMNGIEFLEEIRKDPHFMDSVVFVLTTSKAEEDRCEAYKHNVAGYIVKEHVGKGFLNAVELLDHYWRVVEMP